MALTPIPTGTDTQVNTYGTPATFSPLLNTRGRPIKFTLERFQQIRNLVAIVVLLVLELERRPLGEAMQPPS